MIQVRVGGQGWVGVQVSGLAALNLLRSMKCVNNSCMCDVCLCVMCVCVQEGVGDTPDSYAYDGNRVRKWNVTTTNYGKVK